MNERETLEQVLENEVQRIVGLLSSNKDKIQVKRRSTNEFGNTYVFDWFGKEIVLQIYYRDNTKYASVTINGAIIPNTYTYNLKSILMDVYDYNELHKQIRKLKEVI